MPSLTSKHSLLEGRQLSTRLKMEKQKNRELKHLEMFLHGLHQDSSLK